MISSEFQPSIFHPYFFVRRGLLNKITQYQNLLTGKMMDFGCGSKPYKGIIKVIDYVGVDFENEGHPHDNEQIDIFYDGKTIPVPDNHFDSALSSEVFEHVFNLEEVLKEIHRVLKPGAKFLITCPFIWKEHEMPNDFARYTHFALQHILSKSGFKVETFDKSGNFIEVIFQLHALYFYDSWYPKFRKIPVVSQLFLLFFIAIPNMAGRILSRLLPQKKSMYLNNIIIAEKC